MFFGLCRTYMAAVIVEAVVLLPAMSTSNSIDQISASVISPCATNTLSRSARPATPEPSPQASLPASKCRRAATTSATNSRRLGSNVSVTQTQLRTVLATIATTSQRWYFVRRSHNPLHVQIFSNRLTQSLGAIKGALLQSSPAQSKVGNSKDGVQCRPLHFRTQIKCLVT